MTNNPKTADTTFELLWPKIKSHTLLGRHKARSLYNLVASVSPDLDVAECGVFRGGMVLMMALQSANTGRKVWAFDSFEGLPSACHPSETCYYQQGALRADEAHVRNLLVAYEAADRVLIRKGLFESTLDSSEIPTLGLVHVDCDVYSSAKVCIDRLYDRLAPGGLMVFDDYFDLGGGVGAAVNEHLLRTGEILYAGPVEQAYIVKGRRPEDDPPSDRTVRLVGPRNNIWGTFSRETIWPEGLVLDATAISQDQEYQRDLETGEAVPDLPGGSLQRASRYAERMLRVCDYHRTVALWKNSR